ncbi:MAG TPA: peptidylprolyl isomerase [Candidatus Thermoplasmatota archaeon]|nr:peptidylprolyl isomerase [Candidatus Thermoplasmatota archaeon]
MRPLAAGVVLALFAPALAGCLAPPAALDAPDAPRTVTFRGARVETALGSFTLVLYPEAAPKTVANFEDLARRGFYDGTLFHRVVRHFVIQGGDPTGTGQGGSDATVPLETNASYFFSAGALGMARDLDPDSATSQFFVCEFPQPHLKDPKGAVSEAYGRFTVFGQVVEGMEVVRAIGRVATWPALDRPREDIPMKVSLVDVVLPEETARDLPLRTLGRFAKDGVRSTLELPRALVAEREARVAWYVDAEDGAPPRGLALKATPPEGPSVTTTLAPAPDDPGVLSARVAFATPGTWRLALVDGGRHLAEADVEVEPA